MKATQITENRKISDYLPGFVEEAFHKLGEDQRGPAEIVMVRTQRAIGGGVLSSAIEHTGDLINRMTAHLFLVDFGYEMVADKVYRMHRLLTNPYGFGREFEENCVANADYYKVDVSKYKARIAEGMAEYRKQHLALPSYNKPHLMCKSATDALGRYDWDAAGAALADLRAYCSDIETYKTAITDYTLDADGNLAKL